MADGAGPLAGGGQDRRQPRPRPPKDPVWIKLRFMETVPPYLASNCKHAKFATVFPRYKQQGVDFHE